MPLKPLFERGRKRFNECAISLRNTFLRGRIALAGYRIRYHGLDFSVQSRGIDFYALKSLFRGEYEAPEIEMAAQFLDPALPLIELGGNIGVVACITNRLLKRPDRHVVVEPNPLLHEVLERNRNLNGCGFKVVQAALGYEGERGWLRIEGLSSQLDGESQGAVPVKLVTLEMLLKQVDSVPIALVCDIEGGEVALIEHEGALLARQVAWLIAELHPRPEPGGIDVTIRELRGLGFEQMGFRRSTFAFRNRALTSTG